MKKSLVILIAFFTLLSCSPVQAETVTKKDVQLRDDVILELLFHPSIKQSKNISANRSSIIAQRFSKSRRR